MAASLLLLAIPARAAAATITVNTTADSSTSACTLRDAITAANSDGDGGKCVGAGSYGNDTIDFAAGVNGTIRLGSALPRIFHNLTIQGPGAGALAVARNTGAFNIFWVDTSMDPNVAAAISGLTVKDGLVSASGGGEAAGGGIINDGTLTLDRVVVSGNAVSATRTTGDSTFAAAVGGGIWNASTATLTLRDSTVSGNTATATDSGTDAGGSGAIAEGGGVENDGTLDIERSTISGNTASATSSNTHPGVFDRAAGGLDLRSPVTIVLSTVGGNQATASNSSGTVTIATGGIFDDSSSITAAGDTLAFNSGAYAANLGGSPGFTLENTIISNPAGGGPNCNTTLTDGGYNLEDANDCGLTAATDLVNTNPQLITPLAANGSPNGTETYALPPESPAVDRGTSAGQSTDQRDLARPFDFTGIANAAGGDGTDIGAFELQGTCLGQDVPGGSCPVSPPASGPTGERAAALKKCKKKHSRKKRRRCRRRAMKLPL